MTIAISQMSTCVRVCGLNALCVGGSGELGPSSGSKVTRPDRGHGRVTKDDVIEESRYQTSSGARVG